MADAVDSGRTQAVHAAAARHVAEAPKDASASKPAPAKPISSGIFGTASPREIVKRVKGEMFLADSAMNQTLRLYDNHKGGVSPPANIAAAEANKNEQVLLQDMAAELKERIRSLEADPKGPVAGLKELKDGYDRLQKQVQAKEESGLTRVQVAGEIVAGLEGPVASSEHALLRVVLREQAESDFRYALRSGDPDKISDYKQLLLHQANRAKNAWKEAVDKVDQPGGNPKVIENFKHNLHAAEVKYQEIQRPDYGQIAEAPAPR